MLGQHPQLYGFPELNLFVTDTIGDLLTLALNSNPWGASLLTGMLRAVAQLKFGVQTEGTIRQAEDWIRRRSRWTTKRIFDCLLGWIHPRVGLDKSPRTCLSQSSIDRALSAYPECRIIHLTRHPVATLDSLIRNHGRTAPGLSSSADPSGLAIFYAHLWLRSQELILFAISQMAPGRFFRISSEELILRPDDNLRRLTKWLEIKCDGAAIRAMKHPENSPFSRPAPMGLDGDSDQGFLLSPRLRPSTCFDPCNLSPRWRLGSHIVEKIDILSRSLGYGSIEVAKS
jgi:hypothetical protein